MLNINFVPEDYIQSNESRRINLMYLVLLAVVMIGLGGSFMIIKIRQRALGDKEKLVNEKMADVKEGVRQFEQLQEKVKIMKKTALTTAALLEPVPRSVLLASLTNNLPTGVSLLRLNLVQKEAKGARRPAATNKYQAVKAGGSGPGAQEVSPERFLRTYIDIEGIAPSNLQVAAYIKRLSNSSLLDNVTLEESRESKIEDSTLREFKLKAMLRKNVHLTNRDIERIRAKYKVEAF